MNVEVLKSAGAHAQTDGALITHTRVPDLDWCVPEWSGSGGEDRRARQPRLNIAEGVDHVAQRGVEQRDIVVDDADRRLCRMCGGMRWAERAVDDVRQ